MATPRKRARRAQYYALVVPGIEEIASQELRDAGGVVDAAMTGFDRRDSIVPFRAADGAAALDCGSIEDVFRTIVDAKTFEGPRGAQRLAAEIEDTRLEAAILEHHALRPKRHGRTYKVVARVAGRHAFRREDVVRAFERALAARLPRWSAVRGDAALEVWVHVVGERTIAGIRLSDDALANRRDKRVHLPASLKPTVASALVHLASSRPRDVFLDPMCGAGTILLERGRVGRSRLVLGGDVSLEAVMAARGNVRRGAALACWDARRLPLRDACVDAIAVNPPYGRAIEAAGGVGPLYRAVAAECARVLRPGGRCVVLTGEPAALSRELPTLFQVLERRRILLRGLSVTAFVLLRR